MLLITCDPLVALVPVQAPEAAQLVALALVQSSVEEPPAATALGVAVILAVGAGAGAIVVAAAAALSALWLPAAS